MQLRPKKLQSANVSINPQTKLKNKKKTKDPYLKNKSTGLYKNFKKIPPHIESKLDKIFYNIGAEGSLSSVSYLNKLYPSFKKYWKSYLQSINSYNITLPSRKRFKRLKYIVAKLNFNFQADIAYMIKLNKYKLPSHNRNIKYLLVIQDTISRFMYVYTLKTKSSSEVSLKFEDFYKKIPNKNIQIFSDRGSEFLGKTAKFFKKNNKTPKKVAGDRLPFECIDMSDSQLNSPSSY